MKADYRINIYNEAGTLQAIITNPLTFAYSRIVNAAGMSVMKIRGNHPVLSQLNEKWIIEVHRKPSGGVWRPEFAGYYQDILWEQKDKAPYATLTSYGLMIMLAWRISGYKANTTNRTAYYNKPAETIAKTLVSYNAGANATVANDRETDGVIAGLSVEADSGKGKSTDWFCAWQNLLETLQKLAEDGGGDFDLIRTGATTYEFKWYDGQQGTDKSSDVIFALERGNMANPTFKERNSLRVTSAIVGGQGEEDDREIEVVKSSDWSASSNFEAFVAATDVTTQAGLISRGETRLSEGQKIYEFGFEVLQTPSTQYGIHYDLGDLVGAINPFNGQVSKMKVTGVGVSLEESGNETVKVELRKV